VTGAQGRVIFDGLLGAENVALFLKRNTAS
jgi:hypothetical protein